MRDVLMKGFSCLAEVIGFTFLTPAPVPNK